MNQKGYIMMELIFAITTIFVLIILVINVANGNIDLAGDKQKTKQESIKEDNIINQNNYIIE